MQFYWYIKKNNFYECSFNIINLIILNCYESNKIEVRIIKILKILFTKTILSWVKLIIESL